MKEIRIALIGAGYIADYHARGLQAFPNVEIVAVVGLLIAARKFADKYGIKEATTQVLDLFDRDDIDAVVIGTLNKFHTKLPERKEHCDQVIYDRYKSTCSSSWVSFFIY